jgi:sugar/nucleoside kinase (ribokinase family)
VTRVLVAGDVNVDVILRNAQPFPALGKEVVVDDCEFALGGASAICAHGLARLGNAVSFATRLGDDERADFCLSRLAAGGVDVSPVLRDPRLKTGITVSLTSCKDRALVTFTGSTASLRGRDIPDELLRGFSHLHVSSYYLQAGMRGECRELFARAGSLHLTTSIDCGFDPSEKWDTDLLEALIETDLFFPNEVELRGLTGATDLRVALALLENGRTRTIAKLGARGCATLDRGTIVHVPAFPIEAVDTTGSGDSFDAGFLHGFLREKPLLECLMLAAGCGALSTLGLGGTTTQPDVPELTAFLASRA